MWLWLKIRRVVWSVGYLIFCILLLLLAIGVKIPLPSLGGAFSVAFDFIIVPSIPIFVFWGMMSGDTVLEAVSNRPIKWFDLGYITLICLILSVLSLLFYLNGESVQWLTIGRNIWGYFGISLLAYCFITPHVAGILPFMFMLFAGFLGIDGIGYGQAQWWAWPFTRISHPYGAVASLGLFLLGAILFIRSTRLRAKRE